ncbi:hypothetical protein [Phyllobacterium sp. OV277]|jgi:hypothetical protein|uniref:hypothetical protein n=1 Tax=Phyllobacterium sp. OV277 TaxID=1882772 RepID=UPI001FCDCEBF|nr:hypothetical protein [Phyllobacterium sp. OV277]
MPSKNAPTLMRGWSQNEQVGAVLGKFLKDNSDRLNEGSYRSFFKKLACMYDYLAFGFDV